MVLSKSQFEANADDEKGDKLKRRQLVRLAKAGIALISSAAMLMVSVNVKTFSTKSRPEPLPEAASVINKNVENIEQPVPEAKLSIQDSTARKHQMEVVDRILNQVNFKTIQSKWCIDKKDDNTSFTWVSQGDGTLPTNHVSGGIEKKIGELIATILSAEEDKGKFMVDVGMNSGYFGVMGASMGFPVIAFDPQPACHALMKKTIDANGFQSDTLQTFLMGLGDGGRGVNSDIEMHITSCHGGYSWPDVWQQKDPSNVVKVPVHTLAEVIGDRHVSVMKMDTEGNEVSILTSGVEIFERGQVDYLIVELKPKVWKERGINTAAIYIIEKLAKSVVNIGSGITKSEGSTFHDGDWLFTFIDKPTNGMKKVAFNSCVDRVSHGGRRAEPEPSLPPATQ